MRQLATESSIFSPQIRETPLIGGSSNCWTLRYFHGCRFFVGQFFVKNTPIPQNCDSFHDQKNPQLSSFNNSAPDHNRNLLSSSQLMRLFAGTPFDIPPKCERCGALEADCQCTPLANYLPPAKQTAKLRSREATQGKGGHSYFGIARDGERPPHIANHIEKCVWCRGSRQRGSARNPGGPPRSCSGYFAEDWLPD